MNFELHIRLPGFTQVYPRRRNSVFNVAVYKECNILDTQVLYCLWYHRTQTITPNMRPDIRPPPELANHFDRMFIEYDGNNSAIEESINRVNFSLLPSRADVPWIGFAPKLITEHVSKQTVLLLKA